MHTSLHIFIYIIIIMLKVSAVESHTLVASLSGDPQGLPPRLGFIP